MTPYAVLLVKPTDTDELIRKTYHVQARKEHPDLVKVEPSDNWYIATTAYTAVKTETKRAAWMEKQSLLSGFCDPCGGSGVRGTRMFKGKIKICEVCKGEGRIA